MASCGFALRTYVLIAVGAFLALLRVAFVILAHPFQALKKTPRDGKEGGGTAWAEKDRGKGLLHNFSTIPHPLSPPGMSVGPLSGDT